MGHRCCSLLAGGRGFSLMADLDVMTSNFRPIQQRNFDSSCVPGTKVSLEAVFVGTSIGK